MYTSDYRHPTILVFILTLQRHFITFAVTLKVGDEVAPGAVLVPGQRPSGESAQGTINVLCSDRYSDLGEGATYQSTFLDVRLAT